MASTPATPHSRDDRLKDDDEDDMFKGRMGYEDFMKKIERH